MNGKQEARILFNTVLVVCKRQHYACRKIFTSPPTIRTENATNRNLCVRQRQLVQQQLCSSTPLLSNDDQMMKGLKGSRKFLLRAFTSLSLKRFFKTYDRWHSSSLRQKGKRKFIVRSISDLGTTTKFNIINS